MMDADGVNAIGTAVIALTTTIGVLSTLVYYLANSKGMHLSGVGQNKLRST